MDGPPHYFMKKPQLTSLLGRLGCRPSRIASTMSGARQIGRQEQADVGGGIPSCSPRSVIDFA
jgi:hypothetical protein